MPHESRNRSLGKVSRYGRSAMYSKRQLYKRTKSTTVKQTPVVEVSKTKTVGGDKNGKTRVVPLTRESRFYAAEDIKKPLANRKKARPTKFRASLTPGTILILLAGRHEGRRVVCLGQLPSGLLLVTGPFKCNGVNLRRVNPAYVVATSASVDVSGIDVSKFNDTYFSKPKEAKTKKSEAEFMDKSAEKKEVDAGRKADQEAVDSILLPRIQKVEHLEAYMHASFSLKKGQYPHLMKF